MGGRGWRYLLRKQLERGAKTGQGWKGWGLCLCGRSLGPGRGRGQGGARKRRGLKGRGCQGPRPGAELKQAGLPTGMGGPRKGTPRPRVGVSWGQACKRRSCWIRGRWAGPRPGMGGSWKGGAQTGCWEAGTRRGPAWWAGLGLGGTCGTLTGDLEEADRRAHVVGDAALVAAAAVAGDGVEAQLGVVGGLAGAGGGGRRRQQLPFEAPHGRGDALGAASEERAAQEHRPAQGLAHVLGAGLHLRRDWGRRRGAVSVAEVGLRGGPWARRCSRPYSPAPSLEELGRTHVRYTLLQ